MLLFCEFPKTSVPTLKKSCAWTLIVNKDFQKIRTNNPPFHPSLTFRPTRQHNNDDDVPASIGFFYCVRPGALAIISMRGTPHLISLKHLFIIIFRAHELTPSAYPLPENPRIPVTKQCNMQKSIRLVDEPCAPPNVNSQVKKNL